MPNLRQRPLLTSFWMNPDAFAFNLLAAFLDTYEAENIALGAKAGELESLNWTPETIEMELRDDFGVELPPANYAKLMTAICLQNSDGFFVSEQTFLHDCVALSGVATAAGTMIFPDSEDIAWGVNEALLLSPPEEQDDKIFSDEIIEFIRQTLQREGLMTPPDVLRLAARDQQLIDRINSDYADDPEMAGAIWQVQADRTADINRHINSRLRALLSQLQRLPLRYGKATIVAKLLAKMPAAQ